MVGCIPVSQAHGSTGAADSTGPPTEERIAVAHNCTLDDAGDADRHVDWRVAIRSNRSATVPQLRAGLEVKTQADRGPGRALEIGPAIDAAAPEDQTKPTSKAVPAGTSSSVPRSSSGHAPLARSRDGPGRRRPGARVAIRASVEPGFFEGVPNGAGVQALRPAIPHALPVRTGSTGPPRRTAYRPPALRLVDPRRYGPNLKPSCRNRRRRAALSQARLPQGHAWEPPSRARLGGSQRPSPCCRLPEMPRMSARRAPARPATARPPQPRVTQTCHDLRTRRLLLRQHPSRQRWTAPAPPLRPWAGNSLASSARLEELVAKLYVA